MKTVLITGANGFAGHHLINHLLAQGGYRIFAGVFGGSIQNDESVTAVPLNLSEPEQVNLVVNQTKPDWVFHLAALSSPAASLKDHNLTLINNIYAEANLLSALVQTAPKARVLVIGSAEEYGLVSAEMLPINETCPLNPLSPYAVSKISQDYLGRYYYLNHHLPVIRVRPFNHIGERQTPQFVVPAFAEQIAKIEAGHQEPVIQVGDLSATRDFTDVKDMVRAYELALTKGEPGEVYNLGSGKEVKIEAVLHQLLQLSTAKISVQVDPGRLQPSLVPRLVADCQKFHRLTGWQPQISLEDTLARVLDYWRQQISSKKIQ